MDRLSAKLCSFVNEHAVTEYTELLEIFAEISKELIQLTDSDDDVSYASNQYECEKDDLGLASEVHCFSDSSINGTFLELLELKKRWKVKEVTLREKQLQAVNSTAKSNTSADTFSAQGSSSALTNDLLGMMLHRRHGLFVEPVDDNIHCWNIKMSSFSGECALTADLSMLDDLFK